MESLVRNYEKITFLYEIDNKTEILSLSNRMLDDLCRYVIQDNGHNTGSSYISGPEVFIDKIPMVTTIFLAITRPMKSMLTVYKFAFCLDAR